MLRLRTFGGLSLERHTGALRGAASQKRRLAILVLLAVARDRGLSRDKLVAYLWPEEETERARHTLSQLLYALRRDLECEAVTVMAGDMLRLNSAVISSDVAEFEDALDASELERGVALYGGAFLDGWYVGDTPEFERWQESQRSRLSQRAVVALRQLAEGAMRRADSEGALGWWRRLATIDPLDARAAAGLMTALAAAGDRAAALRHARIYESLVREEIGETPDPLVSQLAQELREASDTTPTRPVLKSAATPTPLPVVAPVPIVPPNARSARRPWRQRVLVFGATGVLALVGYAASTQHPLMGGARRAEPNEPTSSRKSVAVLPFVNLSSDSENEYFSDGMTEELINTLATVDGLRVPARTSAFAFKGKRIDIKEIGRQLNVATVLEGSVRKSGNRLRVTAQLIDAESGFELWSEVYDQELNDVFRVQEEISRAIANKLRASLRVASHPTGNVDAYDLYLRGRYFWNQRTATSLNKSIEYYGRALALDSAYALAYAGLADSYAILGANGYRPLDEVFPKSHAAAATALALDSSLSSVHATLALINWLTWQWTQADEGFRRSITSESTYVPGHIWYALFLSGMGRSEEAIREIEYARQLDPLSLIINTEVGRVFELARRDSSALIAYRRTLDIDSTFWAANYLLVSFYSRTKQFDSAAAVLRRMAAPARQSALAELRGYMFAMQGKKAEAQRTLADLRQLAKTRYVSPFAVACIYAALGDRDEAMRWLDSAQATHASEMFALKVDPVLDPLRGDPRFAQLLHRMQLN